MSSEHDMLEISMRAAGLHDRTGQTLRSIGGFLRCEVCGSRKLLGNVGHKLRNGWPKCCDLTMRWWTQRQVDAGEVPELVPLKGG